MSERTQSHQVLGRYQLLVAVARGGMGQVWLARLKGARGFNKVVAIKTLLPNEEDRARLEHLLAEEARLASLIQHANVVHTMELGEDDGLLYLVMEWVDGEPLSFLRTRAQERGGMPLGVAVALVSQVLAGLHAAHELNDETGPLGVVHRDVSPHNVLVTYDGVAKLLDFGVAKATEKPSSNTGQGEIKGKFSYMAPEQILGEQVDRRCDVFAVGVMLYWLTTGQHPFKRHNTAAVIHAITSQTPVAPPSTLAEDFPEALESVLRKALEKDRELRWSSAEEMRAALEQAMPQAFDDEGRFELKSFMERAVGDRKVARHEAVRRAQLAADKFDSGSGARSLQAASSQSVSSLRAIAISQRAPLDASAQVVVDASPAPQPRAPRSPRAPWIAASVGIALALATTLPRLLAPRSASPVAASGGVVVGSALVVPAPASVVPSASTVSPAVSAVTEVSDGKPAKKRAAPKAKPSAPPPRTTSELLAPEYAR
jgi:eukaryotic-like serine/threonine-protein kinase